MGNWDLCTSTISVIATVFTNVCSMRITSGSVLAAFALTASAAPVQDDTDTASPTCDVNNQVWSTGSLFELAPVSRITEALRPDIDNIHGTPKSTPKAFEGNLKLGPPGGMGGSFKESDHFRVYGASSDEQAAKTLAMVEAAYVSKPFSFLVRYAYS